MALNLRTTSTLWVPTLWVLLFGCGWALVAIEALGASSKDLIPAKAFGALPPIADIALSPDGNRAVTLKAIGDTYHVMVMDFRTQKTSLLMSAGAPDEFAFNWCRWANNTRIVCSIRSYIVLSAGNIGVGIRRYADGRTIMTRLLAVNADRSNVLQLVPRAISNLGGALVWNSPDQDSVISWLRDDPDHILMQIARDDRILPSVYKLDINTNRLKRVRRFHASVYRWYADPHGNIRAAAGFRDTTPVAFRVDKRRLRPVNLGHLMGVNPPEILGFTRDGKHVFVSANHDKDKRGIYEVALATGEVVDTLFEDDDYDVYRGLILHPDTSEPIVLRHMGETQSLHWFDDNLRAMYERVKAVIPGAPARMNLVDADEAFRRFIFRTEGNGTSPRYYLYDDEAKSLALLSRDYPVLDDVTELTPTRYRARDGRWIPAYYAIPDREPGTRVPTIIFPHGGPYARDTDSFDYWTQFFLSRGYAVLKPNFRGSSGYGDAFMKAGFDQWGLKMQDDLIDGLDWMIDQGITDPQRVCIVGGSYGGYATLVAAYKTPERFRCGVSFAGVSDLPDLIVRMRSFVLGELSIARVQKGKSRIENSPLHKVEQIELPLLIVHGDVDRRVPVEQSRNLVAALEAAGKDYRYIEQPNGNHYLSLQSHRIEFFEAMDEFLRAHLR